MADETAGKVPVLECVRTAWVFLFEHWRQFLPAALIMAAISQAGLALALLTASSGMAPQTMLQATFGNVLALGIPASIAGLLFTAAILRKAVRGEFTGRTGLALGADELRLLGAMLAMMCLFFPLIALVVLVLVFAVFSRIATSEAALQALLADPDALNDAIIAALGEGGAAALSLFILIVFAVIIVLAARLLMINAATIGERRIVLLQTWGWSRGNVLRVIGALILTALPVMLLDNIVVSIFASLPIAADAVAPSAPLMLLTGFCVSFTTALTNIPLIVLGAVLYKGLRPRDFVAK